MEKRKPIAQACPPLPAVRCLNEQQAASYLGLGRTLFREIGPPPLKIRSRNLWDRIDLDAWLDDHKRRGRAKEENLWPEKEDSISARTHLTGGSTSSFPMDDAYAEALGLETRALHQST